MILRSLRVEQAMCELVVRDAPLLVGHAICHWILLGGLAWADESGDWITMFNGKNLEGWTPRNGFTRFDSRNGFIGGAPAGDGGVSYLCTVGEFGDFELQLEVKVDSRFGDAFTSAIQIRSRAEMSGGNSTFQSGPVCGPQIKIAPTSAGGGESGKIYLNGEDGESLPMTDCAPHHIYKNRKWNLVRIVAKGPRVETFVNGRKVDEMTDQEVFDAYPRGFIALQVRPRPSKGARPLVMWRHLRIRPLD